MPCDKKIEIKNISITESKKAGMEVATFTGAANVMEMVDSGNDIIHKGAFQDSIDKNGGSVHFFTDHLYKTKNFIGIAKLSEEGDILKASVDVLLTKNPEGEEFFTKAKFANENDKPLGLSIGFNIPDGGAEMKDGVRHIHKVDLWEVSGVVFPMNSMSRAVGFKSFKDIPTEDLMKAYEVIKKLLDKKQPTPEEKILVELTQKLKSLNNEHN